MSLWLGVDPGGSHVGIVLRQGDSLVDHVTINRSRTDTAIISPDLIAAAISALDSMCDLYGHFEVAVEDVVEPHAFKDGKRQLLSPKSVMGVSAVAGAVIGRFPAAVLVPPAHNGQSPLAAYPDPLRPSRGNGAGHDSLRHCRSAWDVAGAGPTYLRIQNAQALRA